jgi:hypothetical protein
MIEALVNEIHAAPIDEVALTRFLRLDVARASTCQNDM